MKRFWIQVLIVSDNRYFFLEYSIGLVYLMYRAFEQVCIHKPNTSRPANSERYIICKGKRAEAGDVAKYMFELNCRLNKVRVYKICCWITSVTHRSFACQYKTPCNPISSIFSSISTVLVWHPRKLIFLKSFPSTSLCGTRSSSSTSSDPTTSSENGKSNTS